LQKKCEFHQEAEKQLKTQLSMYTEKYEEFQTTLKKSNQVFESFRSEMDKMTKKIKKLENETASWKNKWEGCDKTLQNVIKQREEIEEKLKKSTIRADTMEKLSRTLQTERNSLQEQVRQLTPIVLHETAQNTEEEEIVVEAPVDPQEEAQVEQTPLSSSGSDK
jgi:chromosome segregation ATPase